MGIWFIKLLFTMQGQSDPILLKILGFSARDFGIIGIASKMKSILIIASDAILNVIFPRLTKDFIVSKEKFNSTGYTMEFTKQMFHW